MIAALFVQTDGCYFNIPGVDPWDEKRDARLYDGPHPVVAHPPCQLWGNMAFVNYTRWGGDHNRPGNDGGCFYSALKSVEKWGGVLEHPAFTRAWEEYGIPKPEKEGWTKTGSNEYICEVWQSAYGHQARKRTWLFYSGQSQPPEMNWAKISGTHQIGFHDQRGKDRNKPTISGKKASATPIAFRDLLIQIAEKSRNNP